MAREPEASSRPFPAFHSLPLGPRGTSMMSVTFRKNIDPCCGTEVWIAPDSTYLYRVHHGYHLITHTKPSCVPPPQVGRSSLLITSQKRLSPRAEGTRSAASSPALSRARRSSCPTSAARVVRRAADAHLDAHGSLRRGARTVHKARAAFASRGFHFIATAVRVSSSSDGFGRLP